MQVEQVGLKGYPQNPMIIVFLIGKRCPPFFGRRAAASDCPDLFGVWNPKVTTATAKPRPEFLGGDLFGGIRDTLKLSPS
jgi:hypothetical protein